MYVGSRTLALSLIMGLFLSCDMMKEAGSNSNLMSILTQNQWLLHSLGPITYPSSEEDLPYMNFEEDGTFSGYSGCNAFNGTFELKGTELTLEPGAMTRKACPGTMEQEFIDVLGSTTNVTIEGAQLNLLDGAQVLATFLPNTGI